MILPANQDVHNEYDMDENDDLLELLGNLGEYTTAAIGATKKSTEDQYIEETVKAVENVGRFSHINSKYSTLRLISRTENQCVKIVLGHSRSSLNEFADYSNRQVVPFTSATPDLIRLNKKWQEQLKAEKERARRNLITGNYDEADDVLDLHAAKDAVVTVVDPNNYNKKNFENYASILPVVSITTNLSTQQSIADEFTLNKEQRAAFMIITSHLDGDSRCRTGILVR